MTIVYAATHATKEVARDEYGHGESESRRLTMIETINVEADSLADLIAKLGERYSLNIDDVFIGDESEPISFIDYDRYETADCEEPTDRETEEWKAGRLPVWHAVYSFMIEKRSVSPLTFADFQESGIKTH